MRGGWRSVDGTRSVLRGIETSVLYVLRFVFDDCVRAVDIYDEVAGLSVGGH